MTRYPVQPRERIFVKVYGLLAFAKNSGKYNQKLVDHTKQSATDALKAVSKRAIQKTAKTTGDLIGDKIANRIAKVSRSSLQNNSETITNEHDKEMPKESDISPEERQNIIYD